MGGDSVVAIVGDAGREIGQFALRRCHGILEVHSGTELHEGIERLWMIGHGPVHIGVHGSAALSGNGGEHLYCPWIGVWIVGIDER